jgi:2-phospho-L-lactate guanylyltransferase (CobY/MobA/RfbA family)
MVMFPSPTGSPAATLRRSASSRLRASVFVDAMTLRRRPPTAIAPAFGPESAARHREAAAAAAQPIAVIDDPAIAFDVDVPDDILGVLRSPRPTRAREVLAALGADDRMRARA